MSLQEDPPPGFPDQLSSREDPPLQLLSLVSVIGAAGGSVVFFLQLSVLDRESSLVLGLPSLASLSLKPRGGPGGSSFKLIPLLNSPRNPSFRSLTGSPSSSRDLPKGKREEELGGKGREDNPGPLNEDPVEEDASLFPLKSGRPRSTEERGPPPPPALPESRPEALPLSLFVSLKTTSLLT